MRALLVVLLLLAAPQLAPPAARAQTLAAHTLAAAVRAGDWNAAALLAAAAADPVAARLVRYLRALAPGAATAAEIAAEIAAEPGWPQPGLLARRYADALAAERDDRVADALCRERPPATAPALLRCADAMARAGHGGEDLARRAWIVGITDPAAETATMKRWGPALNGPAQAARFERLAWTENAAPGGPLARQAVRVDPALRPLAEARLALRRDDPAAPALAAALPPDRQADPGLVLDLAQWLRRAARDSDAAALWTERGAAAALAAPPERQAAFWAERNRLARRLLQAHDDALAYAVAALPTPAAARADAAFLAGWIALRRLAQPETAAAWFRALADGSAATITQGRAAYWLGRALQATGDRDGAQAAFRQAASWPTTYYGQLGALAAGDTPAQLADRIRATPDPAWDAARALDFAGTDLARAATLLAAWGQFGRARPFLAALETAATDPAGRSIAARFAAALGLPDQAVAMARLAGRDGVMLPHAGWPDAAPAEGTVERAVALGLIRQESSFDPAARSPVGAIGLMQLMPATAAQVARGIGTTPGDLTDAANNMRLGTAYLAAQLGRFGALPAALAAYNAGPNRARDWIATIGDPAAGAIDPIDWIELIPFDETRNYVQRIVESVVIYRARDGATLPHPVLQWAENRT